jgi:hypothetical protein
MTEQDKENLRFLLESTPEIIHAWFQDQTDDNIRYAMELLEVMSEELRLEGAEINIAKMNAYPEAMKVLAQIMKR